MIENISNKEYNRFYQSLKWPGLFVALLWIIHLAQIALSTDWGYWGIFPRSFYGLKGVFTAPLIHGDFSHLVSNSIPLLVLGTIIFYFYRKVAVKSFVLVYLLTGIVVWLLARSVFHIGASGVVYGLVAFLLGNGIFRRNVKSIVLALVILFFYSGMFVGVLPNQEGISWESHLYGAFAGLFTAYFYKEEIESDEVEDVPFWVEEEGAEGTFFLEQDVFKKTFQERQNEQQDGYSDWTSTNT